MSLVKRTIEAFPLGRTTEQLLALLESDFDRDRRASVIAELSYLSELGDVRRGSDGRWRSLKVAKLSQDKSKRDSPVSLAATEEDWLMASPATISSVSALRPVPSDSLGLFDPSALLRYYRAALRSDPRGALTQTEDRHGTSWQLLTGQGRLVPGDDEAVLISIDLDALPASFRQALLKREAEDQGLAIGWPIAVGRKSGEPVIWPVGLLSAHWIRTESAVEIRIEADDLLINPDWIRGTARTTGWSRDKLTDVFSASDSVGQPLDAILPKMKEAMAGHIRGRLTAADFVARINPAQQGIYDAVALFLPTDTTFTAGAVRDLDAIAAWDHKTLARTALAPLCGLDPIAETRSVPAINTGPLNAEQIQAVRNACQAPLSVVTGPPGTGKSQAIVAMVASVLNDGGTVLVASRNHQALDAVQERLSAIAPGLPFLVRTLDPAREVDMDMQKVLAELLSEDVPVGPEPDRVLRSQLASIAAARSKTLDGVIAQARLNGDIASILERIEARERHGEFDEILPEPAAPPHESWLVKIIRVFKRRGSATLVVTKAPETLEGMPTSRLRSRVDELRAELSALGPIGDPVAMTEQIVELVKLVLPVTLASRVRLDHEQRSNLENEFADLELAQGKRSLAAAMAQDVVRLRPLWLTSVLGTPKRIPLQEGLFDLVIFDEASQCDIASALPLFARARRAVVVGDDRQLSFMPQIGRAEDTNLMQAQGLPLQGMGRLAQSSRSLFDAAIKTPGVPRVLLRDQYRSAADIVRYISSEFYGDKLRCAGDQSSMVSQGDAKLGIAWIDVPAPRISVVGNVNPAEVQAITAHLLALLGADGYVGSVGVIAPFRPQVAALEEALRAALPESAWKRADLRVGTVDSFQGQERDLILFSPVLGPASAISAVGFVQKDWRRINVAISRARAVAQVFGDLDYARSNRVRSLARLAAAATEPRKRVAESTFDSIWERRVWHALRERGLEAIPQYEIAGRRLDFALFGAGSVKLDLEVDGRHWHEDTDGKRKSADLWRDHQLKSMGWRVRRFWVDELAKDLEACLDLIERDLA
jgi:very-short-patch-repair endonuclease